MNKTIQNKNWAKAIRKTKNEGTLKTENLHKPTESTDVDITNRIQGIEERISSVEDTQEETNTLIKENVKSKPFQFWKAYSGGNDERNTKLQDLHDIGKQQDTQGPVLVEYWKSEASN